MERLAAACVLLLLLGFFALRRWAPGVIRVSPKGRRLLEVTARLPLDGQRQLYVVRAAGEYVLIGGSENGVTLLKALDADAVRAFEPGPGAPAPTPASFLGALRDAARLERRRGTPDP